MIPSWQPEIVVYHDPCIDGYTSYWLLNNAFSGRFQPMPHNYGKPFPFEACAHKRIMFADYSLPKADLQKLVSEFHAAVVILDHHESAQKALIDYAIPLDQRPENVIQENLARYQAALSNPVESNLTIAEARGFGKRRELMPIAAWFDMDRSGAGLVWDWLYPNMPRSSFVNFVQARDLFRPELMGEEADLVMPVSAYIRMHKKTLSNWNDLEGKFDEDYQGVKRDAQLVWKYHMAMAEESASKAFHEDIAGFRVPVVNTTHDLGSDVSVLLLKKFPDAPFVGYFSVGFDETTGKYMKYYGLRSENGRESVSVVATRLGGGGHRNASGFRVPL